MSMQKSTLRELDSDYINIKLKFKKTSNQDEKYRLYQKQFNALTKVKDYVDSYKWLKNKKAQEKLDFIRKSDYDYKLAQKELGMTYNAVKCFMYQKDKLLIENIGADTLSLITSNNEENISLGLMNFYVQSGTFDLENIFLKECLDNLPKPKLHFYDLKECLNEIYALYTYTKIARQFAFEDLDPEKLEMLVYILTQETEKYRKEQKLLLSLFQGINIGIEDFKDMMESEEED